MRAFTANPHFPPSFKAGAKGSAAAIANDDAPKKVPPEEFKFPDHWNEPDVRGLLYAAQGRVCGFCGCYLPRNDRGDVEHYRPKSSIRGIPPNGGYWWLAYEPSNYLLSCGVCNRTHKRTKFPLLDEVTRVDHGTRIQIGNEQVVLFHPAIESVEDKIVVDIENGFIDVVPGLSAAEEQRVKLVRDFFQWNIDSRLVLERREVRDLVLKKLDQGLDDEVKVMASRFHRHSLMTIAVLNRTNRTDLIPSAEEELTMFALEMFAELKLQLDTEKLPGVPASQKVKLAETLWMARALWEGAGAAERLWMEQRWDTLGCRKRIEDLSF